MSDLMDSKALSKFDAISFAKKIISEVESIRSYSDSVDTDTGEKFQYPIESRLNAFFRLIGLPMFVTIKRKNKDSKEVSGIEGNKILNPGFSGSKYSEYSISDMETVIFSESNVNLETLLTKRENTLQTIENEIGNDEMNQKMNLSLRGAIPLVPNIPDPPTGNSGYVLFGDQIRTTFKMLTPVIPKYIKVKPRRNEIARPFVGKQDRMVDNFTELKRPFLEEVARIRLISGENSGSTKETDKQNEFYSAIEDKIDSSDFNKIKNSIKSASSADMFESFILNKLFGCLMQIVDKWKEIKIKQEFLAKKNSFEISIKTTSSRRSPFGKRTDISTNVELRKDSEDGLRYERLQYRLAKEEAFLSLLPTDDVSDKGNNTKNIISGSLMNQFTDLINHDINQIKKEIKTMDDALKKNIQSMEKLRLEIDMMTGEFTGLSVPDVIAVMISLFVIEKEELLALFDKETKENMKKDDMLKSAIEKYDIYSNNFSGTIIAIENLNKIINFVYFLLNSLIKSSQVREKSTKRVVKNSKKEKTKNNVNYNK